MTQTRHLNPLLVHGHRDELEVAKLLLLFGAQPPLTNGLFWRLVKAAVLVGYLMCLTSCS